MDEMGLRLMIISPNDEIYEVFRGFRMTMLRNYVLMPVRSDGDYQHEYFVHRPDIVII